ncbi:MAG: porin [Burkholderiales bacterium]|nr:porin [Burkholderiales bacterium]
MKLKATKLPRKVINVLLASALIPFGAQAADDQQALRAEVDALKKELQELRGLIAAGTTQAASREQKVVASTTAVLPTAPRDKAVTVGGGELVIYGTLNADFGTVERSGATVGTSALNSLVGAPGATPTDLPGRNTVRSNSSNLGFRGKKDLAGGVSAVFQIESSIGMDGAASTLAGRDTFVGLTGGFGSVLYGSNMDSPYKRSVQGKDPFYATGIATQKAILGSPGFNVVSVNAVAGITVGGNAAGAQQQNAGFDARRNNLLVYRSPNVSGFSGEIAYGANEQKSTSAGAQVDPGLVSLLGRYEMGPLFVSYSYERNKDVFGLNSLTTLVPGTGVTGALFSPPAGASSTDTGNRLGLGYRFGDSDALLVWENLKYETNIGPVSAYDRSAWVASLSHRFGAHRAIASYAEAAAGTCTLAAGGSCSTFGLGAKQWAFGYDYTLDSSTNLYAFWSRITNEAAAAYNFGVSGAPAAGVGADPQALALGIRYKF